MTSERAAMDDERARAAAVGDAYALDDVELELIRKGFNDHYRVRSASGEHILRLYVEGKYYAPDEQHFRFELALLEHLKADGVPVAAPIRRRDGAIVGRIDERLAALFEVAPGEPMRGREWDHATAAAFGDAAGRLHESAAAFTSALPRYTLDLTYLRDEPIRQIEQLLARTGRAKLETHSSSCARSRRSTNWAETSPGSGSSTPTSTAGTSTSTMAGSRCSTSTTAPTGGAPTTLRRCGWA